MSVTSFLEIHDGRDGADDVRGRTAVRRYTRVFRATTNDDFDDANTVVAHVSCPRLGTVYPTDIGAWCKGRRANSINKRLWIVTATYSSEREMEEDPAADPPQFTWSTQQFQRIYVKDRNGKAIVNSAGDPYDPPVEGDDSRVSCTVSLNVASVPSWVLTYKDAVNSAAFTIDGISVNAGSAKVQSINIGPVQSRNDISFRQLSLTLTFAASFAAEVLDAGFNYKDDAERKKITLADGNEPTAPVLLDGSGAVLANPTLDNAVYNSHDIYTEMDFSALPLS